MMECRSVFGKRCFKARQGGRRGDGRLLRRRCDTYRQRSVLRGHGDLGSVQDCRLEHDLDFAFAARNGRRDEDLSDDRLDDLIDRLDYGHRAGGRG